MLRAYEISPAWGARVGLSDSYAPLALSPFLVFQPSAHALGYTLSGLRPVGRHAIAVHVSLIACTGSNRHLDVDVCPATLKPAATLARRVIGLSAKDVFARRRKCRAGR